MSYGVLKRMIASYMATDQPQYSFSWQGGEPTLMGLDFFKRVTHFQQKYGRKGSAVSNALQTNGTLITDDWARHLRKYNFLVGISLDGTARVHDAHRKYADGRRGSHESVMKGIACLRKQNVDFNILTLVNHANVGKAREIYRYFCDNGFLYQQYIECVEFDEKGRLAPFAISGEEWGNFLCEIYDEWIRSDTRRVSIRLFDSILVMMVEGIANVCQMGRSCCEYFVVEHNGDVYPCDFFVEKELNLGNIGRERWDDFINSPVYTRFGKRKSAWNSECEKCAYLQFCAGDCPKNRFYGVQDTRQLSAICRGWKMFYEHSLDGFRTLAEEIRQQRE